jgi:hypothetical protein
MRITRINSKSIKVLMPQTFHWSAPRISVIKTFKISVTSRRIETLRGLWMCG